MALHDGTPLYVELPGNVELSSYTGVAGRPFDREDQARA